MTGHPFPEKSSWMEQQLAAVSRGGLGLVEEDRVQSAVGLGQVVSNWRRKQTRPH